MAGSDGIRSVRRHNLARALTLIAESPAGLSRTGIARSAELTKATAGSLVDDLLAAGLVSEETSLPAGRVGRPATSVHVDGAGARALGLEINVDYLAVCVVDLTGTVLLDRVLAEDSRVRPPAATLRRVAALARAAIAATGGTGRLAGAVLAVPGLIDATSGGVRVAPNLGWQDVPVAARLQRLPVFAGLPLAVANEADAAAVAEAALGRGDATDFVRVSGEVGVGASVVLHGAVQRGTRGWAGELGHLTVDAAGPPCACGSNGCVEQYAGQEAVLRAAGLTTPTVTARSGDPSSVETLVSAAGRGDRPVLTALAAAGRALGLGLAGVLNVVDVGEVILGGSHAALASWLLPALRDEMARRVVWARWAPPRVTVSALGPDAAVLGAAEMVRQGILADPQPWINAQ